MNSAAPQPSTNLGTRSSYARKDPPRHELRRQVQLNESEDDRPIYCETRVSGWPAKAH